MNEDKELRAELIDGTDAAFGMIVRMVYDDPDHEHCMIETETFGSGMGRLDAAEACIRTGLHLLREAGLTSHDALLGILKLVELEEAGR